MGAPGRIARRILSGSRSRRPGEVSAPCPQVSGSTRECVASPSDLSGPSAAATLDGTRPAQSLHMVHNIKAQHVRTLSCAASSVTLQMTEVAAGEERPRCWIMTDGVHCARPSALRITGDAWDGYVYACVAHVERVVLSQPDATVEPIPHAA
jgi:hypothetical protein